MELSSDFRSDTQANSSPIKLLHKKTKTKISHCNFKTRILHFEIETGPATSILKDLMN